MVQSLCKLVAPAVCALAVGGGAAPAGAHLMVGISDDGAGMFSAANFKSMHVQTARYITFWNVAVLRNKGALRAARAWITAAERQHVTPLISFGGNGNYVPTVGQYTSAVKAFLHDFPSVKNFTAWNEPDWIYRPKLSGNPGLAAAYFNALARVCHRCTIAAGDVYTSVRNGLSSWLAAYKRGLHARPKAWALHNYDDVRSHTTSQLRTLLRYSGRAQIWLTEISGVIRRGHWQYKNQSVFGANRDERFLFALPKRFHNITRIYHYQWQGTVDTPHTGWDSGLIGPGGKPRPAYYTVRSAAHGKLP